MTRIVALSGGVGGAKMVVGLDRVLAPGSLTVVANTGDDFDHLGLRICPDLDSLLYAMSGTDDPVRGWGRRDETWNFLQAVDALGGPGWFRLGDADLATHVFRTHRLAAGETLSSITRDFFRALGVGTQVLPMTDDPVRTQILSGGEWIDFQEYFVRRGCDVVVEELRFRGAAQARVQPEVLEALRSPDLGCVVICPSNPFLSIAPILALPGLPEALRAAGAPVVAITPIIGGQAVKGPTARLMKEFGMEPSAAAVADHYADLIDVFVADVTDEGLPFSCSAQVVFRRTYMDSLHRRETLAREVLALAGIEA